MASRKKADRREILAVRIDKSLKRKLAAIAAKSKRSITGQIAFMVEALVEQDKIQVQTPA